MHANDQHLIESKDRSLMNVVAHYPTGTTFFHSEDSSAKKYNVNYIFQFVNKAIKYAGPENVIKIVTNNALNNMATSSIMQLSQTMH